MVVNQFNVTSRVANKSSRFHVLSKLKLLHLAFMLIAINIVWGVVHQYSFLEFWLSKDQQAYVQFEKKNYAQSAVLFDDPLLKGYSYYLSGDFTGAIEVLGSKEEGQAKFIVANSYAHTAQFKKAKVLYNELLASCELSNLAENNLKVVEMAIEKIKSSPPKKQGSEKVIDDRNLVEEQAKEEISKVLVISDQVWLKQVRQNPSKFLRQKFQQEYSHEQK